jgi:hypothetical protein
MSSVIGKKARGRAYVGWEDEVKLRREGRGDHGKEGEVKLSREERQGQAE